MLTIYSISAFLDNYIWVLVDTHEKTAVVVDSCDAKPGLDFLKANQLIIDKYPDHCGRCFENL